jgi:hypothetical protein
MDQGNRVAVIMDRGNHVPVIYVGTVDLVQTVGSLQKTFAPSREKWALIRS